MQTPIPSTASLIPGSFVLESDRDRRILYLHVIGVRTSADVEKFRSSVIRWERRIVRAVGTLEQVREVETDRPPRRFVATGESA